jgi:DNA-binding NarL/FixJ family response regulator
MNAALSYSGSAAASLTRPRRLSPPAPSPLRIAVVSEDRMLREVVEGALAGREGLEPVPAAGRDEDVAVDVALIDAGLDRPRALARTRSASERWPAAQILVIGLEREDETVVDLVEAGAAGYVLKGSSPEQLVAAIHAARQGLTTCAPRIVGLVVERIAALSRAAGPAPAAAEIEPLTPRERETLVLLAEGLTNKEAARRLRITVQTVKNHVHRILEKLRVHRRRDAVRLAYELGLLAEPRQASPAGWLRPLRGDGAANGLV